MVVALPFASPSLTHATGDPVDDPVANQDTVGVDRHMQILYRLGDQAKIETARLLRPQRQGAQLAGRLRIDGQLAAGGKHPYTQQLVAAVPTDRY